MAKKEAVCQFCGKKESEVNRIITATTGVSICDECIEICCEILEDGNEEQQKPTSLKLMKPHKIKEFLDEYIIAQEEAKKQVAVAVANHIKRIKHNENADNKEQIDKSNILMLGDTGSGKSYIWKMVAKLLNVPFVMADAPSFTSAG